jgi:hypothetical protein
MFENFLNDASTLGLDYLRQEYITDDNATAKDKQAQKYEQIQQKSAPAPDAAPILNQKIIVYGGLGLVALFTAVVIFKK